MRCKICNESIEIILAEVEYCYSCNEESWQILLNDLQEELNDWKEKFKKVVAIQKEAAQMDKAKVV